MTETYCGKNCADCAYRERLACPGCKAGPGRAIYGDCTLAKCCRDKGHESCETCGFHTSCGPLRGRADMPQYRLKKLEAEAERRANIARKAPFLGKWLWILFWLVIPQSIAGIMTNETVVEWAPGLKLPGQVLSVLCAVAYGLILLRLSKEEGHYRTAAICCVAAAVLSAAAACFSGGEEPGWTLVITLPGAVVSLVGEYHEFMGHAEVLSGVDNDRSEKWRNLWKWNIGLFGALLASVVITLIVPMLGMLVMLAAMIGILVVSILKLVYLYRAAKLFREYPAEEQMTR